MMRASCCCPDNLLQTDSLIRELVTAIPEEGVAGDRDHRLALTSSTSRKKDQVIGKVVASVDIPAATQLFTPNWIVKVHGAELVGGTVAGDPTRNHP